MEVEEALGSSSGIYGIRMPVHKDLHCVEGRHLEADDEGALSH